MRVDRKHCATGVAMACARSACGVATAEEPAEAHMREGRLYGDKDSGKWMARAPF